MGAAISKRLERLESRQGGEDQSTEIVVIKDGEPAPADVEGRQMIVVRLVSPSPRKADPEV